MCCSELMWRVALEGMGQFLEGEGKRLPCERRQ